MLILFFKLVNLLFMLHWLLLTSIIVISIKLVPVISADQVIRHQQGNHAQQYPHHKQVDGSRYATLLTCEGQSANITCLPGTRINLIRANFGRFSISICNEQGNAGMQVDCMSTISFRVLSDLCENRHECHVEASTSKFGDACPGSTKYLEVHYQCISEHKRPRLRPKPGHSTTLATTTTTSTTSTTTTTPSPFSGINEFKVPSRGNQNAIDIDLSSSKESTLYNKPNYPSVSEEPSLFQPSSSSSSPSPHSSPTTPSSLSPSNWPEYPSHDVSSVQSSSSLPFLPSPLQPSSKSNSSSSSSPSSPTYYSHSPNGSALCPPMNSRNLFWNWTQPGIVVRQNCPSSSEGWAKWFCSIDPFGSATWIKPEADLSGCKSKWLITVENRIKEEEPILATAFELVEGTKHRPLYGGDLSPIIDIIGQLISKVETGLSDYPEDKQFSFVQETLKIMLDISSNLLDDIHRDAWYDLSPSERTRSAAALISEFERITLVFMETATSSGDYYQSSNNLYMSVHAHRLDQLPNGLRLPKEENKIGDQLPVDLSGYGGGYEVDDKSNPIYLPRISLSDLTRRNMIRVGYVVYGKMGHLLDPIISEPYGGPMMSPSPLSSSPSDDNGDDDDDDKGGGDDQSDSDQLIVATIVNSDVVGVLVPKERSSSMILLREPIEITFRHLVIENITNARCVFWDTSQWSEFGCNTIQSNNTHTICRCNHLTNFAVLVDFTRQEINGLHGLILHSLTQIGCIVSSFCLCICLVTFVIFRNLRAERTFIHTNLCLCLLAVQLIFILGIDKVSLGTFCSIIAAALHYCLLSSFLWMLMEGIHLYYMLIEVFEPPSSRLPIYFITAYVSPLTIIGLTLGLSRSPYGASEGSSICWMDSNVILQSFVLPMGLILACNFVFLVIAQCAMCKHIAPSLVHKEVKHQDRIKQIRRQAILIARYKQLMLWARGSLALVFLLGITWSFGILYVMFPSLVTAYLFTGFNVFQGVCIFIFSCLINDKVRREYIRAVSRCSWLSWFCCQLCSTFDGEKVSSNPLDRAAFFHPATHQNSSSSPTTHHSSSLIQVTSMTSSTTTTGKPSSSGSSAGGGGGGGGQGIPLSSCPYLDTSFYPESEEPMIGSGSSQLLSGRKIMTTSEDGTTRIYDHSTDGDLDCEMETRALMEGLSHSDATSGPMRPIIMRGDVSLTRIPGEHLYECIPEDSAYHSNNLLHSSGLTSSSASQYQQGPNYLHHNHAYHQYQQPLTSSSTHLHQQQQHYHHHHHQTLHHPPPHSQYPSEYQQLHQLINKQPAHSTGDTRRSNNIRDNIKYNNMIGSNTLDRRSTLQRGNSSNQRGSSDELLPAIIRDNTRSPYGVTLMAPNCHQIAKELVASPLSASSSTSSTSSASTSSNLPTTRLNIPVSPQRTLGSHKKSRSNNRKPKTVFAKLKGNQIVSTTGTVNGDSC